MIPSLRLRFLLYITFMSMYKTLVELNDTNSMIYLDMYILAEIHVRVVHIQNLYS
jgi:hypothetical protein